MVGRSIGFALVAAVSADIYMQNPRGSNNRLDEENRDRNNGNRLFDSQNNNRGGVNVGQLYYLVGSELRLELAYQHSGLNEHINSEILVQYMCDDRLRDGTSTNTIPTNPNECYNWDCDTDVRFGRHESYESYATCKTTERNKGLFTSSQNLKGNSAIYTRQNPNGGRRGYECAEERDYYPYWNPSPWVDLAVLVDDTSKCDMFLAGSQNQHAVWSCTVPINGWLHAQRDNNNLILPITQAPCELLEFWDDTKNVTVYGKWTEAPAKNAPPMLCQKMVASRANHLGNVADGQYMHFTLEIPDEVHEQCSLRVRYNISTKDFPHRPRDSSRMLTSVNNSVSGNNQNPANVSALSEYYGLNTTLMGNQIVNNAYGYELRNNPDVKPFKDIQSLELQLAINTAQYGRTFQDRSHKFSIRQRPSQVEDKLITNIGVRGKRGNIVQTYPSNEYDFTPNKFHCTTGNFIHLQWSGSNTNPNNNAGQGRQGSDRSNIVMLRPKVYEEPGQDETNKFGQLGRSFPRHLTEASFLGLGIEDMKTLATLKNVQFGGEMSELDDAGTYFDFGVRECTKEGTFHYMSTRNNNFSNRSQKAAIKISNAYVLDFMYSNTQQTDSVGGLSVSVSDGALSGTQPFTLSAIYTTAIGGATPASSVLSVEPATISTLNPGRKITVSLPYNLRALQKPMLMQGPTVTGPWVEVEGAVVSDGEISGDVTSGGYFVVVGKTHGLAIFGIVAACLVAVALGVFIVFRLRRRSKEAGTQPEQRMI